MANVGGIALSFSLTGDVELDRKLRSLPGRLERKVISQALRVGAKVILPAVQAEVPERSGTARQSLKVRAGKRSKGRVSMTVVTDGGFFKGKAFYFPFDELGHRVGARRLGAARTLVAGKHWMRHGFAHVESQARTATLESMREGVEREAAANG